MTIPGLITDIAAECAPVMEFLKIRTGLVFCPARAAEATETIRRAMAGQDSGEFVGRLASDSGVLDGLIDRLTVGETYFFREPAQYEFIRREVLPKLAGRRQTGQGIRAWSAGCASGEEAYSLAILMEEDGVAGGPPVLGTDICRAALRKAREAEYGTWSFRGTNEDFRKKWFDPSTKAFKLRDRIRSRCVFEHHNLAFDAYPTLAGGIWSMDLIMCRNVFIYFGPESVRETANRLFATLAEGGWLITGPSDPPLQDLAPFEIVNTASGVMYRRRGVSRLKTSPVRESAVRSDPVLAELAPEPPAPDQDFPARSKPPADGEVSDSAGVSPEDTVRDIARLRGFPAAELAAAREMERNPARPGLALLRAVLLMEMGRNKEAEKMASVAVYLDRKLAMAHFVRATLLRRSGDVPGARKEYRNALNLTSAVPSDSEVPFSDGGRAGQLAESARAQLALLDRPVGVSR